MSPILLPSQAIPAIVPELLSTMPAWDHTLKAHIVPPLVVSDAASSGYNLPVTQQLEYVEKEEKYQHQDQCWLMQPTTARPSMESSHSTRLQTTVPYNDSATDMISDMNLSTPEWQTTSMNYNSEVDADADSGSDFNQEHQSREASPLDLDKQVYRKIILSFMKFKLNMMHYRMNISNMIL